MNKQTQHLRTRELPSVLTSTPSFSIFQVSEFPCVCFLEVPVPQHQLKGGRRSRSLKRNAGEPASLPVTSTYQKPRVINPWSPSILPALPRLINRCTFIPVCLKRRNLARHRIHHGRAETVNSPKFMNYPLPTCGGTGLPLSTCSTSTDTHTHTQASATSHLTRTNTQLYNTRSTFRQNINTFCNYKY